MLPLPDAMTSVRARRRQQRAAIERFGDARTGRVYVIANQRFTVDRGNQCAGVPAIGKPRERAAKQRDADAALALGRGDAERAEEPDVGRAAQPREPAKLQPLRADRREADRRRDAARDQRRTRRRLRAPRSAEGFVDPRQRAIVGRRRWRDDALRRGGESGERIEVDDEIEERQHVSCG